MKKVKVGCISKSGVTLSGNSSLFRPLPSPSRVMEPAAMDVPPEEPVSMPAKEVIAAPQEAEDKMDDDFVVVPSNGAENGLNGNSNGNGHIESNIDGVEDTADTTDEVAIEPVIETSESTSPPAPVTASVDITEVNAEITSHDIVPVEAVVEEPTGDGPTESKTTIGIVTPKSTPERPEVNADVAEEERKPMDSPAKPAQTQAATPNVPTPRRAVKRAAPNIISDLQEHTPEVEGKRSRKSVQRWRIEDQVSPEKQKTEIKLGVGSGTMLGEIEIIELNMKKTSPNDLKTLHSLLFGIPGRPTNIRKHLRQFNGFDFDKDSADYKKKLDRLSKYNVKGLRFIVNVLGLRAEGAKTSGEYVDHILRFLMAPNADQCKEVPKKAPKKKSPAKKRASKKTPKKAADDEPELSASEPDQTQESIPDEQSDKPAEDSAAEEESEHEAEVESPKPPTPKKITKAKVATPKKKQTPKKTPAKTTPAKAAAKATPTKRSATPSKKPTSAEKPPTDAQLKATVRSIVKTADLNKVTMKMVIEKVFAKFPGHDLSERRKFIKDFVKQTISNR